MKKLIYILVVVALCLIAMVVAPSLIGNKGYVLVALGNLVIETSVVALGIMLFTALIGLYVVAVILGRAKRFTSLTSSWFGGRAQRKQVKSFYRSIQALAEGEWDKAQQAADLTEKGEFEGVNYLVAAQAAVARGRNDTATRRLYEAAEFKSSALAARVTLARMALSNNNPQQALVELNALEEKQQNAPVAVKLRIQALAQSNEWESVEQQLTQHKKALGDDYAPWSKRIAKGRLAEVASKQGAIQLKAYWEKLPRKYRNDIGYQAAYAEQLFAQGMHQEAQTLLLSWQKRGPNSELYPLFKQLQLPNPAPTIQALEAWIKVDEENTELYTVLGQVAYQAGDLSLANKALQKAMTLKPTREGLLLLAQLNEQTNNSESALSFYKQSLTLQA